MAEQKLELKNKNRIDELYIELKLCYTSEGCDHEKATSILNSIIERKKLLNEKPQVSKYVDFKRMISHYVRSMKQKELDYDEINNSQIEKKIREFSSKQALHLYELYKRELSYAGFSSKAEDLKTGISIAQLKVYKEEKGLKSFFKWLSIRISYKTRYLVYMLLGFFISLNIVLLPNEIYPILEFNEKFSVKNSFLNHVGNVIMYILDLDQEITVKPINFWGVLLMFIGKAFFILFIVNFLIKRIFNKIID